jgi:hypothetical protein
MGTVGIWYPEQVVILGCVFFNFVDGNEGFVITSLYRALTYFIWDCRRTFMVGTGPLKRFLIGLSLCVPL